MGLTLAKILLAPVLLALCTIAAQKWGDAVGGWLMGLPIVSGPISVLLFMEYGESFARNAARGTLLGLVATAVFCTAYARLACHPVGWRVTLLASYAAAIAAIAALSQVDAGIGWSIALVAVLLLVLIKLAGLPDPRLSHLHPSTEPQVDAFELAPRMAIVGASVWGLTAAATVLGATLAGLIAPLPVSAAVMAASAHRQGSRSAARGMLRGAVAGTWGGAAFFSVVGLTIGVLGPAATYGLATGAALLGTGVALRTRDAASRLAI